MANTSRKQAPRSIGPYEIKAIISRTAIKLRLPAFMHINPIFHGELQPSVHSFAIFDPLPSIPPSVFILVFKQIELVKTLSLFPVLESALGSSSMY